MKKKITNLIRKTLTFTLSDKSTLILFPGESKPIDENLMTTGLNHAYLTGIILIEDEVVYSAESNVEEEVELMQASEEDEKPTESVEEVEVVPQKKTRKKSNRRLDNE